MHLIWTEAFKACVMIFVEKALLFLINFFFCIYKIQNEMKING